DQEAIGAHADMVEAQCLDGDFPKFAKIDGAWQELTAGIVAGIVKKAAAKNANNTIAMWTNSIVLAAAKTRWGGFDFSGIDKLLNQNSP
ncbi:MAG: hypothetical protein LBB38_03170, partial [Puniceicoccales bacterium]|nr:hypothetical protein [Puniceicoccales bacterium]